MKRAMDILLAFVLMLSCLPLGLFLSLMVLFFMGWPILFRQIRPGLSGKPFTLLKFRTMIQSCGKSNTDAQRLTLLGRGLRKTSLDEMPQLWNVLVGEMSLVGPRPLLMEYLPLYTPEQARRMDVRPGITGWAQVNGRNAISWEEKFRLDVWYVDNRSFFLDMKILWMTMWKVFSGGGVTADQHATMPSFTGSRQGPASISASNTPQKVFL